MKRAAHVAIVLSALLAAGCTSYLHVGRIEAEDSSGAHREVLLYWNSTERRIWFDETSGTAWMKTQCSLRTVTFVQREDGVYFFATPEDAPLEGNSQPGMVCGRVLNVRSLEDIQSGPLQVTIICKPKMDSEGFTLPRNAYLKARSEPYTFPIEKREGELKDAPQVARCAR